MWSSTKDMEGEYLNDIWRTTLVSERTAARVRMENISHAAIG